MTNTEYTAVRGSWGCHPKNLSNISRDFFNLWPFKSTKKLMFVLTSNDIIEGNGSIFGLKYCVFDNFIEFVMQYISVQFKWFLLLILISRKTHNWKTYKFIVTMLNELNKNSTLKPYRKESFTTPKLARCHNPNPIPTKTALHWLHYTAAD